MKALTIADAIAMRDKKVMAGKSQVDQRWLAIQMKGLLDGKDTKLGPYEGIMGAWAGEPAFVVGCSYGLKIAMDEGFTFESLDGFHSIGINHAIEDYDGFEWFIVQDKRFFEWTTYDMDKYKGRVFVSSKCQIEPSKKYTVYYTQEDMPTGDIHDGLFSYMATGMLALHLAIISGAEPIYMIGCDNGGKYNSKNGAHYKKDYPHEVRGHPNWARKYVETIPKLCHKYLHFKRKIYNVDPYGDIPCFPKKHFSDIKIVSEKRRQKLKESTICHVGTLPIDRMGDITRNLYYYTSGKHIYADIRKEMLPKADIYLLECFKAEYERFVNFRKPKGSKVISIVHSSEPCMPAKCSDQVITLTEYWKNRLQENYGIKSKVMYGAIRKNNIYADYESLKWGRISRNAPGKFHDGWNNLVSNVSKDIECSECILFLDKEGGLEGNIKTDIKINHGIDKIEALSELSVAVFAHGDFVEIFPMAVLECMAAGLPIVALSQPSMDELIGRNQIICKNIEELEYKLKELLPDTERKKELGRMAKIRAEQFSLGKMQQNFETICMGVL
jgi:glycosyltransferase involved in cell wall biosynthesis